MRYELVFHILEIGAHLDTAGVRVAAVYRGVGGEMRMTSRGPGAAERGSGCTKSEPHFGQVEQRRT